MIAVQVHRWLIFLQVDDGIRRGVVLGGADTYTLGYDFVCVTHASIVESHGFDVGVRKLPALQSPTNSEAPVTQTLDRRKGTGQYRKIRVDLRYHVLTWRGYLCTL